ncbi:MAG: DUF1850 domain-containing protein [Desulfobacteraceae bacterium]|nr:DUF1850 domain-containing protein [Desulfobacteraceae bacterium]
MEITLPKKDYKLYALIRVKAGDPVILKYRHSVELSEVEGVFAISPTYGFIAVETRYESAGTGLPDDLSQRSVQKDGFRIVDEENAPIGQIGFYIVKINRSRLFVSGLLIPISHLPQGTLIRIKAHKIPQIVWMLKSIRAEINDFKL